MLTTITLAAGAPYQAFGAVRSFFVVSPSNGAIFEVDSHGKWPMPTRMAFPKPCDVGFQPGPTSPLELLLDLGGGSEDWTIDANTVLPQEGDLPPTASTTTPGQSGVPLYRQAGTGKLIIPQVDASGNSVVSGTVTANQGSGWPAHPSL